MLLQSDVHVTGMGIATPIGIGVRNFSNSLKSGKVNFHEFSLPHDGGSCQFVMAKTPDEGLDARQMELTLPPELLQSARKFRNVSRSAVHTIYSVLEAWASSGLSIGEIDPSRMAIVLAGSNTQQSSMLATQTRYRTNINNINPMYGLSFLDTDILGIISQLLNIEGEGYTVGAASASGNMGIIHGHRLMTSGSYDVVIVGAPMMELSIYEMQAFKALGALAEKNGHSDANDVCRPFDKKRCGFVYGENTGCVVLESESHVRNRKKKSFGRIAGYGLSLDANRNPNPSVKGERQAMLMAVSNAGLDPSSINYVNTHGTGSRLGDEVEVEALISAGFTGVKANSTKSLIGHGISSAGLVELISCLVQMDGGFIHPSRNMEDPITSKIDWSRESAEDFSINYAINNSFGFGGINTSVVLQRTDKISSDK